MSYAEYRPHHSMSAIVDRVWTHESSEPGESRDILPDGAMDLIATLHPDGEIDSLFVVGAMTKPFRARATSLRYLGIRFRPGAAGAALGVSAGTVVDQHAPLTDLRQRQRVRDIMQRAINEHDHRLAIDAPTLGRVLSELNGANRVMPATVRAATQAIARSSGRVRIEQLAQNLRVSRQQLARVFAQHVGLTPKGFASVCRVRALLAYSQNTQRSWSELAAAFNYVDQSHLIAEVRKLTGRTPMEWRRDPRSISPISFDDADRH